MLLTHKNLLWSVSCILHISKKSSKFLFQTGKFSGLTPLFNDGYINHNVNSYEGCHCSLWSSNYDLVDIRRGACNILPWPWERLLNANKNSLRMQPHSVTPNEKRWLLHRPVLKATWYHQPSMGKSHTKSVPRCERKTQIVGVQGGSGGGSIWPQTTWDDNEPEDCTQWWVW